MSTITTKLQPIQSQPSINLQETVMQTLLPKPLPDSIINRISSFTSKEELIHTIRPVSKRCEELCPNKRILDLKGSSITDKELIEIIDKNQKSLIYINLSKCKNITDLSLKHLAKLQNLKSLNLSGCDKITDAGIKELSTLQNLTALDLAAATSSLMLALKIFLN